MMNSDKLKQWFGLTQKLQQEDFWKQIIDPDTLAKEEKINFENNFLKLRDTFPHCDLYQIDHNLFLEVELPGFTIDEIHVTIEHGIVVIQGNYHTLKPGSKYFLKERVSKRFKKEIPLPVPVIESSIRYTLQNGLFTLILPIQTDFAEEIPIEIKPEY